MLRKTEGEPFWSSISLSTFCFVFVTVMVSSPVASMGAEITRVTAIVDDEGVVFGDPNADEGVGRGQSHFPENPELYIPEPIPERIEPTMIKQEVTKDTGYTMFSYNLMSGEEIVHEFPTEEGEIPMSGWVIGGIGGGISYQEETLEERSVEDECTRIPLNFSDLALVASPEAYPWCTNVKLFKTLAGGHYESSGILIDPMHVLTAGHIVYNPTHGWASSIVAVPAYEDGWRPYGDASAQELYTWEQWKQDENWDHDIGIILLDRPIGALAGWCDYGYNDSPDFYTDNTFHNPGYPAESPYDGEYMYYWYGNFDFIDWSYGMWTGNEVGIYKYSYSGQSGSGAYHISGPNCTVFAVLSSGTSSRTYFARITSAKFHDIRDLHIANNTPPTFDLVPLDVIILPQSIAIGNRLSAMSYLVHNYSSTSWSGTVKADIYLSTNKIVATDDIWIQSHHSSLTLGPKSCVRVDVSSPPTIPKVVNPGNYYIGVILDISDYNSDNNGTDRQEVSPISITPPTSPNYDPELSGGNVDPDSGDASATFTYTVHYYDQDGDGPSTRYVYIDGTPHTMSLYSGTASDETYRYQTTLSEGDYSYYFYFTDGQGGSDRLPSYGSYSGPSVITTPEPDGDVAPLGNRDGIVNVGDALVCLRFALELETPTQEDILHGDVAPLDASDHPNPDGQITVGDALVILRKALGIIHF